MGTGLRRRCVVPGCMAFAIAGGSRCAAHPTRWQGGNRWAWSRQRLRILERDGHRCTVILRDGTRCTGTPLEVHHMDGGPVIGVDDERLVTVCRRHNPRGG